MIYSLAQVIDNDPACKDKLKVFFLEDYRVTMAELMIPSADISEQISLASTEASGTGNMKLMMNGAITLGTEDGANVEIHKAVGDDNIIIFGMQTPEVLSLQKHGYSPIEYYNNNPQLREALDFIGKGIAGQPFDNIYNSLKNIALWYLSDCHKGAVCIKSSLFACLYIYNINSTKTSVVYKPFNGAFQNTFYIFFCVERPNQTAFRTEFITAVNNIHLFSNVRKVNGILNSGISATDNCNSLFLIKRAVTNRTE